MHPAFCTTSSSVESSSGTYVTKGQKRRIVPARSLLCYWAVQELGFSRVALAKYLGMSPPGVGYAVERGGKIAREKGCALIES